LIAPPSTRRELRAALRARRRALPTSVRRAAAERLATQLLPLPELRRAGRIAFYLAADGEIDPWPAARRLLDAGRRCYLPVLCERPVPRLRFSCYRVGTALKRNRFGIGEPVGPAGRAAQASRLDLLLVPLVAFDGAGNRLGMGGGYFDRTLAYLRQQRDWRRPRLVGVGYAFQQVAALPVCAWDVPLDLVVTDEGVAVRRRTRSRSPPGPGAG